MRKSFSTTRQDTFDTGLAQVDKRGSIRRGDVELPIVDHTKVGDNVSSATSDKLKDDSGVYSQSPTSKEHSPSVDKGFPTFAQKDPSKENEGRAEVRPSSANKTSDPAQNSGEASKKTRDVVDSSRYVDHSKLSPLGLNHADANHRSSEKGDRFRSRRWEEGERPDGNRTPTDSARILNYYEKPRDRTVVHQTQKPSLTKAQSVNKSGVKTEKGKDPSSGSQTQAPEQQGSVTSGENQPSSNQAEEKTKSVSTGNGSKAEAESSKQSDRTAALARLKQKKAEQKQKPSTSDAIKQTKSIPNGGKNDPAYVQKELQKDPSGQSQPKQSEQNRRQPQQPPQRNHHQQQQQQRGKEAVEKSPLKKSQQPQPNTSDTGKGASSTLLEPTRQPPPSSPPPHQPQQSSSKPLPSLQQQRTFPLEPPQENQGTEKEKSSNDSSSSNNAPVIGRPVLTEPTLHVQRTPDDKHPDSVPPTKPTNNKTSDEEGSSSLSGESASPGQKKEGTEPRPFQLIPPGSTFYSDTSRSRPQFQASMSTATEGPRGSGGGGDRLSEITLERDQLVRNEKTYKQRILQLEDEVKSVVRQSQELSSENRQLTMKLEAFETKAYGGSLEVKELRREKQDLVSMVTKATAEKQHLDEENERLKTRLAEMDSKSKQWDALYVENTKLKTKQTELEKRISDLEKEKQTFNHQLKNAESSQADKVTEVKNENKKLQAELINLQTRNNSLEKKVQRQESDSKELSSMLEKKREELDELMRAMQTETNTEMELKETKTELGFAMNKLEDYKKQVEEAKHNYEVLEKEKDAAKNTLRLKESELKGFKANSEEKDSQIGELKRQVDAAKRNVNRLESDIEDTKQVEKDVVNMKARIRSLKNEVEDSLASNHKLKQERTEARMEADRMNRELATLTETLNEARKYIKKLEGERVVRDKQEDEIKVHKKREQDLEKELYDVNARNEQLRLKLREMDEERQGMLKNGGGVTEELQAVNKKLQEDNQKLRHMLVERNMEITQRQSERNTLVHRVDNLERKQNDSEIRVQQLKGWVEGVGTHSDPGPLLTIENPVVTLPPVSTRGAVRGRGGGGADRGGRGGEGRRPRGQQHRQMQQQRQNHLNRSWEDLKVAEPDSIRTTPSLPVVLDSKFLGVDNMQPTGYYALYKNKMKLLRERRW